MSPPPPHIEAGEQKGEGMKYRSVLTDELSGSLKPGRFAGMLTARTMSFSRKSIGRSTTAGYRLFPKQRLQRVHYAIAIAKWKTLTSAQRQAYKNYADQNKISLYNAFLHSYLEALRNDLVLYLALDEKQNTTVKDYSTYTNDGTLSGNPQIETGYLDGSLKFDGSDDIVNCGADQTLNFNGSQTFSIIGWFKSSYATDQDILSKWSETDCKGYFLKGHFPDNLSFAIGHGDGTYTEVTIPGATLGEWNQIAIVKSNVILYGYVNGEVTGIRFIRKSIVYPTTNFYLSYPAWTGVYYHGNIDELRMYKRELSPEEIKAIYDIEKNWHDTGTA